MYEVTYETESGTKSEKFGDLKSAEKFEFFMQYMSPHITTQLIRNA